MNTLTELWQKILNKPYCDPTKRMDFVLFYDVRDGNPNGDPDAGNLPRMDPLNGQGIVTDVCIKRKVRDYLSAVLNRPIFIQSQEPLNTLYFRTARDLADKKEIEIVPIEIDVSAETIKKSLSEKKDTKLSDEAVDTVISWISNLEAEGLEYDSNNEKLTYFGEAKKSGDFSSLLKGEEEIKDKLILSAITMVAKNLYEAKRNTGSGKLSQNVRDKIKDGMCIKYDDIRIFGAVLTAGTNAGQIRGPFQLTFGRSIERIFQMDAAITRCAITRASDWKNKQTEFGRKSWLNWAVYRQHGFFNPLLGKKTFIKNEDLARFWESLAYMFRNSDSASKGEMTMHDIIVFVHDNPRGNAPSHKLFEKVKCDNIKGVPPNSESTDGRLIISRDGFDKYYNLVFPEQINDFAGVSVERPLKDIWNKK